MSQQAQSVSSVESSSMTLMEHLIELRMRLIWIVAALAVGTVVSMLFAEPLLRFLTEPLTRLGTIPKALGPVDNISTFIKVSFFAGGILAMPVIVYQLVAFVSPGLYKHEKRTLLLMLPGAMALFALGASFAFFMMVPVAIGFLHNFLGDVIQPDWTIDRYIGFVTRLVFWIGVAFEMPLIVAFLARAGIVSGPQLRGYWRQAIVFIAVIAAMITPTIDPVNMTLVMGPLIVLFFGSVGLAYLLYRPRVPRDFSEGSFIPDEYRDDG